MGAGWGARLQAMIGDTQRTVALPHPIPIHLEYFTEFVDAEGALQNREEHLRHCRPRRRHDRRASQD